MANATINVGATGRSRLAAVTDTDLSAGAIQVYPASTLGLEYRIQYLPEFPELSASPGTQVVQGFDGDWLEWVLWDAAVKVAYKDDEDEPIWPPKVGW